MRVLKSTISVVLLLLMLVSTVTAVPLTASATEVNDINAGASDDLAMTGTNSLGNMLADEYAEGAEEYAEDAGNNVYGLAVENKTAYVELLTQVEALLVVALYDDAGQEMYATAKLEVTSEDTIVQLDFDVDTMPEYFLAKAYLLDKETNSPLCEAFECDTYTEKMQEFFSKTTEDFDEDKVLNLDEDATNNFLVYNDETILTEGTVDTNVVASTDEATHTYTFENIDDSISSLKEGDIFSHSYDGDGLIIIKVSSISIEGTTATIKGEELEMADVFDYVKIDIAETIDDPELDNSGIDDGVEFLGMETPASEASDKVDLAPVGYPVIDGDVTFKTALTYSLNKNIGKSKITGTASAGFFVAVSCYYDVKLFEENELKMSFRLGYEIDINAKLELVSLSTTLKLGTLRHIPIPGVSIEFTPALVLKGDVTVSVNNTISGHIGKKLNNGRLTDDTKPARLNMGLKVEGSLFLGLAFEPSVKLLHSVIKIYAEVEVGVEVTAELKYELDSDTDKEEIHLCTSCIDGGVYFKINFTFGIELFDDGKDDDKDKEECKWENELSFKTKLCSFYFSFDNLKLGWGSCPNNSYKQTITVIGTDKKPVAGAKVNGVKTDVKGRAAIYLTTGTHTVRVTNGDIANAFTLKVNGVGACIYTIGEDATILPTPSKPGNSSSSGSNGSGSGSGAIVDSVQPAVVETGKCGENVTYEIYSDGRLVISGTGDMHNWEFFSYAPWYYGDYEIKKVIIKPGVTSIGDYAFDFSLLWDDSVLTSIEIPNTVTSIGDRAFYDSVNLKSIAIPDSVTSIGESAFAGCSRLTEITIPDCVTSIEKGAFASCFSLTEITIPDGVTSIADNTFDGCSKLKSVTIPNSVTSIGMYAFKNCSSLTGINIPDSVTSISYRAFYGCSNLISVTIPSSATSIADDAFYSCENLISINTDKDNPNYCSVDGVLFDKDITVLLQYPLGRKQTSYGIPNGVTIIPDHAFDGCSSLTSITIPDSVKGIGTYAFSGCSITDLSIPDGVTKIEYYTFLDCSKLKSIDIPNSVKSIGGSAFENCISLTNVKLPDSLTSISSGLFSGCSGLTSIIIPGSVTTIEVQAFAGCRNLTSIEIPNSVITIESIAFGGCNSLTSIEFPNSVTSIGTDALGDCSSLKNVRLSSNVTSISTRMFSGCSSLTSITIPDSVTTIGNRAFEDCVSLSRMVIPNSVTNIGDYVFNGCSNLSSVKLPDNITSIPSCMFFVCSSLTSITIPSSVESIEKGAFYKCDKLTDVYYTGSESQWNSVIIGNSNSCLTNATIHFNSTGTEVKSVNSIASVGASIGDTDGIVVLSENISDTSKSHTRKHLVPGTEAVLVIMEGLADECSVSTSPILYIAQTTVDADGTATFTSYGDYSDKYWVAVIYGQCSHPECEWKVVYDSTNYLEGLEVYACTICGEVFDSKEIPTKPIEVQGILGDANEDGTVNVKDATAIQKHLASLITLSETGLKLADADGNANVNIKDATAIQKHIAGMDTGYPIGESIVL